MSFCKKCGSEITPGSAFCGSCGEAAPVAETPAPPAATPPPVAPPTMAAPPPGPPAAPAGMPPTPPPMAGPPAYGPPAAPMPMAAYPPPPKGGGGGKVVLFSLLGLLVIGAIVVLLLGFAVGPKWFTGGNGSADAEKVVQDFFNAMQKGDAKAIMAQVDSASLKQLDSLSQDAGYDDAVAYYQAFMDDVFPENDLKITGLQLQTTVNGDTATVKVVGGNATYTDSYGDKAKESYTDKDNVFSVTEFTVKKINGKWYLQPKISGQTSSNTNSSNGGSTGSTNSSDKAATEAQLGAPIYPGAKYVANSNLDSSMPSGDGDTKIIMSSFTTTDSMSQVTAFYTGKLGDPITNTSDEVYWMPVGLSGGNLTITVLVTTESGKVNITISNMTTTTN